jgi:glycine/D-amino acid oxidase-like deaminating enzyme
MPSSFSTPSDVSVIGSGIAGLTAALELQRRGHRVTIYDKMLPDDSLTVTNTSGAAGGQFLPYLHHSASRHTWNRILDLTETSMPYYKTMAMHSQQTGVMAIRNIELVTASEAWPQRLITLLHATRHTLLRPIRLRDTDSTATTYTHYYDFETYSLHQPLLLRQLRRKLTAQGAAWIQADIHPSDLAGFTEPVVQAAGVDGPVLAGNMHTTIRRGNTMTFMPATPLAPVAISAGDSLIIPRSDGSFAVGALYLDDARFLPSTAGEAIQLLAQVRALASHTVGAFTALEASWCDMPLGHNVGYRVVAKDGPIIQLDATKKNIVHNYAYGSLGCTLAFGGALQAADLVDAMQL